MDGPNVNMKLYDSILQEWNENDDYPDLIDIGSWCMEYSGLACRRHNGELMVS